MTVVPTNNHAIRARDLLPRLENVGCAAAMTLAGVALPGIALAAGGGDDHGPVTMELVWQAVNLALLLGVIYAVARKPIVNFFADRREEIKGDIEKASDLLKQAEARHNEWQGKLVELETELQEIQATARRRAEEEREQILAAARDAADRIKADAEAAVDQELRRAQSKLHSEAADLAVDLATKILEAEVDDRERERLLDEFIVRVEPGSTSAGNER